MVIHDMPLHYPYTSMNSKQSQRHGAAYADTGEQEEQESWQGDGEDERTLQSYRKESDERILREFYSVDVEDLNVPAPSRRVFPFFSVLMCLALCKYCTLPNCTVLHRPHLRVVYLCTSRADLCAGFVAGRRGHESRGPDGGHLAAVRAGLVLHSHALAQVRRRAQPGVEAAQPAVRSP